MIQLHRIAGSRRGSALILAVAILAILAIFSLTLGYSSRVELIATRNWTNGVQARLAAATGVQLASTAGVPFYNGPLAALDDDALSALRPVPVRPALQSARGARMADSASLASAVSGPHNPFAVGDSIPVYNTAGETLAASLLQDTSAKINVNAILPIGERKSGGIATAAGAPMQAYWSESALARFIDRTLQAKNVAGVNAAALAHAIAMRRFGADGRPGVSGRDDNGNSDQAAAGDGARRAASIARDGLDNDFDGAADEIGEGLDEPAESRSDPRSAPAGDDAPFTTLLDLMSLPEMTLPAYTALSPYLTTLSVSRAAFDLTDLGSTLPPDTGFPQVDPNTAPVEMIYDALRRRYPKSPVALAAQFAANIVDRRDADDTPTEFEAGGATYLGLERTPLINEVCSDVPSVEGGGDDGQFIEIYNPYSVPLDVTGWTVAGAGPAMRLRGRIASGSWLVLTNDFNEENDPSPENASGLGSFYKLFNKTPAGDSRRIDEYPSMNIPDNSGEIRLLDDRGRPADIFAYNGGQWKGATRSFQRSDPRVRRAELANATPLADNVALGDATASRKALEIQERWSNRPFVSPLDVMLVSSAFASPSDDGKQAANAADWALPVLRAESASAVDVGSVDCFRIGAIIPQPATFAALAVEQRKGIDPAPLVSNSVQTSSAVDSKTPMRPAVDSVFGALNINTASPAVLAALPGMDSELLEAIVGVRAQRLSGSSAGMVSLGFDRAEWWQEASPLAPPAWRNISDLIADEEVWRGRPLYDRLDTLYPFLPLVSTHSMTLLSVAEHRETLASADASQRRPTAVRAERILAADRGALETVQYRYRGRGSVLAGDPDLRSAVPADKNVKLLTNEQLLSQVMPKENNAP